MMAYRVAGGQAQCHRQRQREVDQQGRIVATLDDYEEARSIILSAFTAAAHAGVTDRVRETVETVLSLRRVKLGKGDMSERDLTVSTAEVAEYLEVHSTTALRRLQHAERLGYLENR